MVQGFQSEIERQTLAREIVVEEIASYPYLLSQDEDNLVASRLILRLALDPGATARVLAEKIGPHKRRTIERILSRFREIGLVETEIAPREGQWGKPGTRKREAGRTQPQ